jgi:hypothetical protein
VAFVCSSNRSWAASCQRYVAIIDVRAALVGVKLCGPLS